MKKSYGRSMNAGDRGGGGSRRSSHDNNDDDDDDDEDDRKPPAKVYVVNSPPRRKKKGTMKQQKPSDTTSLTDEEEDEDEEESTLEENSLSMDSSSAVTPRPSMAPPPLLNSSNNDNNHMPLIVDKRRSSLVAKRVVETVSSTLEQALFTPPPRKLLRPLTLDEIILWSSTTLLSAGFFIYQILPTTALVALVALVSSFLMLSRRIWHASLQLYQDVVMDGNGIGEWLLPESLLRTLTQQSLHEFMIDDTFQLEWRHMILYFLPLQREQLRQYIDRLDPRHRNNLFQPGLGNLVLPEPMMRMLIGNRRLQQRQSQSQSQQVGSSNNTATTQPASSLSMTTNNDLPPPNSQRRRQRELLFNDDESDDESDLGLQIRTEDLAGGMNEQQAATMARSLGIHRIASARTVAHTNVTAANNNHNSNNDQPNNNNNNNNNNNAPDEQEDFIAVEARVISDAVRSAASNVVLTPFQSVTNTLTTTVVLPATSTLTRLGFGIVSLSTSLGIYGYWSGIYQWNGSSFWNVVANTMTNRRAAAAAATNRWSYPSSQTVWTTAAIGGTTLGIALFTRSYLTRTNSGVVNNQEEMKKETETKTKKAPPKKDFQK